MTTPTDTTKADSNDKAREVTLEDFMKKMDAPNPKGDAWTDREVDELIQIAVKLRAELERVKTENKALKGNWVGIWIEEPKLHELVRERDEARAEVERLKLLGIKHSEIILENESALSRKTSQLEKMKNGIRLALSKSSNEVFAVLLETIDAYIDDAGRPSEIDAGEKGGGE